MAFTITLKNLGAFAAASNLQLFLRKTSDNTLVNTGGDTGSDADSIGSFTWTVSEERPAEQMLARIYEGSTETAANIIIDSVLNVGFTEIGAGAVELDSGARVKLHEDQPDYAPATAAALAAMRGADNDTLKTLSDQIDGIEGGGSSLTGPYTRTVTVTDADTTLPIQNAKVRLYRTGETGTEPTNVSGVASFTVEAATWSYAITANGYTGVSGTIVVSANGNTPVQMTATAVTPPTEPGLSAIEVLCLGADFTAQADIEMHFRLAAVSSSDQNRSHPGATVSVDSDGDGIARWEAPQGAIIEYKRGTSQVWTRATLDNDSVTSVKSVIGVP